MDPRCRASLNSARVAAGGNPLTDGQAQAIEDRIRASMRNLARTDPNWRTLSADQRMLLGAQQAMQDMADEAARKVANAQRQALKTFEMENRIQDQVGAAAMAGNSTERAAALVHDYKRTHAYIDGIKRDNVRGLMDLISAADSRQGAGVGRQALMVLFDAQNPVMTRDLALEVFAKGNAGTGNRAAAAGAKAWLDVIDPMRQRFNNAGGDVGKLDYGYLPIAHGKVKVLKAGREPWATETLPLVDRARYLKEDGARMSDAEVMDVLRASWDTISSDGANKSDPGAFKGTGARANRGSESRVIHFKDGEAYLAYLHKFGEGSMYDAMIGHIGGLSRDIGLVERYGPNPEAQMRVQFDLAERADGGRQRQGGNHVDAYWRLLNGQAGSPSSALVAQVGQHSRNIQTFGKLQGAVLSSITDIGTYFITVGYDKLNYWDAFTNIGRAANKGTKDFLNSHGMIAESMLSDLNRWAGENVSQSWSGRIANATMRLSLMNAWTDTLRRGFQLTHMQAIGRLRSTDWGNLAAYDQWRMSHAGLTPDDWAVIQRSQPAQHNGHDFVTPDGIYATGDPRAQEVVAKYLGMLADESEVAVLNPDLATRAITTGGGRQAGTVDGELWRAVMQFKSFPFSMIFRHWVRMLETPQGLQGAPMLANRLAYGGALMVSLTALGAIAFQVKQMVSGKDPVDMTTGKFWLRAVAQGGGAGFIGDMLLGDTTADRSTLDSFSRSVLGPSFGSAADVFGLTKGNADEAIAGKDTHIGAEALRFTRSHVPLVNMWYAKAALDHAGLHALQENMSPGYLARQRKRARDEWKQDYWWRPGTGLPDRGPSFNDIAGR